MGAKQVELKFSGIDEFEEPLAIAHPGRHDPDFIFVNQAMLDQGPIKLADAILNDVLAWLLLCLGNCRAMSPSTREAFQPTSLSVVEATSFGRALIRSR